MKFLYFALLMTFAQSSLATLTIYTDRQTAMVQAVADQYTAATKDDVVIKEMPYAEIKQTLDAEGSSTPADIIYVKDLVYLSELAEGEYFQALPASVSNKVDASMRDPKNLWTGISFRTRTLVYEANLDVSAINSYEDLAKSDFAGTLCLRKGSHPYNQAMVASFVANYGYNKAQEIVKGLVANRTENKFYENDTAIIEAIATSAKTADGSQSACLLGLTNSYYLGVYLQNNPNAPVKIKFLKQGSTGSHTNGTGAGIAKTSKNAANAAKFIDLLLAEKNQLAITDIQQDFPALKGLKPTNKAGAWFNELNIGNKSWTEVGSYLEDAKLIQIDSQFN